MILISFIIINFNNSDYLKKLLIGFHGFNTRYSFEVILIDDKSTDDSLNIAQYGLKHIKNFTFIQNEINSGLVYSWKYALDKSNGKYIFFIDSFYLSLNKFFSSYVWALNFFSSKRSYSIAAPVDKFL
jgi:glycosyltransferase involved in cell wall biosynthesis